MKELFRRCIPLGATLALFGALALAQDPAKPSESGAASIDGQPVRELNEWIPAPKDWAAAREFEASAAAVRAQGDGAEPGGALDPGRLELPSFADLVLFDEPGDGALWALGGERYEARFDGAGVTFHPFFGSQASRAFPLELRLAEVRIGGRELAFEAEVPPMRHDRIVSYERGSLVEYYELRADALEQLFHFDRLPAGGDLLLSIALGTELEGRVGDAGLEFSGPYGAVHYSRAVALDSGGARLELETELSAGGIEIRVPESFLSTAIFPLIIDPVIYSNAIGLGPSAGFDPDVAYDQTTDRYCVVFERAFSATDRDVYSVLLDSSLDPIPGSLVTIDFTTSCWQLPKVANNNIADQFLTVCQVSTNCSSTYSIRGRTRQAIDNTMGTQFLISAGIIGDQMRPDVGGDPATVPPTYYCVVWQWEYSPSDHDIHFNLVRPDGTMLYVDTNAVLSGSVAFDSSPSISKSNGQPPFSTQRWTVVWQRTLGSGDEDVFGRQITWDGNYGTGVFTVDNDSANDRVPRVASLLNGGEGAREFLVVYQRDVGSQTRIQGRAFRGSSPVTYSTNISQLLGTAPGESQTFPVVDSDGSKFVLAYLESMTPSGHFYGFSTLDVVLGTGSLVLAEPPSWSWSTDHYPSKPELASKQGASFGTLGQACRFIAVYSVSYLGEPDYVVGTRYDSVCSPGRPLCFGDGSGVPCPCANPGAAGRGCRNSSGQGSLLRATGTNHLGQGDLVLHAEQAIPGQAGIFFQGEAALNAGLGTPFGDGLFCAGGFILRLQVAFPNGVGSASTSLDIGVAAGVAAGETKYYQYWHRDSFGPCGTGFNLSNAYEVTWTW